MPQKAFQKLIDIIAKLRSPEGCPWDRKQTIQSLEKCLEDEFQEVKEAISKNDDQNLSEELGDMLFTIMMMAQIASEDNRFDIKKIIEDANTKLIERHTWVFGDDKAETAEEALALWKKNKELLKKK